MTARSAQGMDELDEDNKEEGHMKRSIVAIALTILLLAACMPFGGIAEDDVTTISFLTFVNPEDTAPRSVAQKQLIEAFEAANPDIKVDVQVIGWAEIAPRIVRSVAAGNPPDVTRVASDSLEMEFAADTLQDLTPYIEATHDLEAYKADSTMNYTLDMDNGQKKAIWIDNRAVMLYYNKEHLAEIGLEEPPKTWEELGEAAQKLTEKGHIGMAIGLAFNGSGNGFVEWFKPTLWSAGGDLLDDNGKAAFNGEAGVKAMQMLYDYVNKYNCITEEILSTDVDGIFQAFTAGRVSMLCFANHRYTTAQDIMGDIVGIAPLPSFDGEAPSPAHITGWMMAIPKGAAHSEEAWRFIDFMTNTEANIINAKVGGELATKKSAFEDPWFSEDPVGQQMNKWREYIVDYGRMPQFPEDYLVLHELLCNAAQQIIFENAPIQEALDAAAEAYNANK